MEEERLPNACSRYSGPTSETSFLRSRVNSVDLRYPRRRRLNSLEIAARSENTPRCTTLDQFPFPGPRPTFDWSTPSCCTLSSRWEKVRVTDPVRNLHGNPARSRNLVVVLSNPKGFGGSTSLGTGPRRVRPGSTRCPTLKKPV